MSKNKNEDLLKEKIKKLANLYLEHGNTEDVLLLSQEVDEIVADKQKELFNLIVL